MSPRMGEEGNHVFTASTSTTSTITKFPFFSMDSVLDGLPRGQNGASRQQERKWKLLKQGHVNFHIGYIRQKPSKIYHSRRFGHGRNVPSAISSGM